jgi:hypothetical protein
MEDIVIIKATPEQYGCWIDSAWGHYQNAELVIIAGGSGWDNKLAIDLANKYMDNGPVFNDNEDSDLVNFADEAEDWMNTAVVPEGYWFGWHDGEFFMMTHEWWMEEVE